MPINGSMVTIYDIYYGRYTASEHLHFWGCPSSPDLRTMPGRGSALSGDAGVERFKQLEFSMTCALFFDFWVRGVGAW